MSFFYKTWKIGIIDLACVVWKKWLTFIGSLGLGKKLFPILGFYFIFNLWFSLLYPSLYVLDSKHSTTRLNFWDEFWVLFFCFGALWGLLIITYQISSYFLLSWECSVQSKYSRKQPSLSVTKTHAKLIPDSLSLWIILAAKPLPTFDLL